MKKYFQKGYAIFHPILTSSLLPQWLLTITFEMFSKVTNKSILEIGKRRALSTNYIGRASIA